MAVAFRVEERNREWVGQRKKKESTTAVGGGGGGDERRTQSSKLSAMEFWKREREREREECLRNENVQEGLVNRFDKEVVGRVSLTRLAESI